MSSVIIEKSTGKVICELCNPRAISKVNQDKYRIVPVGEYLAGINKELEQALKGGLTPNLNTDENGECRHFSTTLFNDGEAESFHCDAVVNEKREVIGKQSKGLHPFFQKESK